MQKDYKEIMRNEFLKRRNKDFNYSQKNFAKDIGIGAAQLNQILNGSRGLSKINAYSVGRLLGLSGQDAKEFRYLVSAQSGRSKFERSLATQWIRFKKCKIDDKTLSSNLNSK